MTGPPEPHFNMCTTTQDYGLVRNSAQESILEWNGWSFLVKTINFSLIWQNIGVRNVHIYWNGTISISLLKRFRLLYRRRIPVFSIYRVSIHILSNNHKWLAISMSVFAMIKIKLIMTCDEQ